MLEGIIIKGDGVGKKLGYPTANIDCNGLHKHLDAGVYAAKAMLGGKEYIAGLVIFPDMRKVEAHLIEYTGPDIYGERLIVVPVQRVSTFEQYPSEKELKKKIALDIVLVKQVFEDPK
ncbi:MAG: hypothetical protein COV60_02135 [Candidatus Magasanikbacteria bacterium CG11_big_fil_rev_8_21_14_0_20_43_7]|uniref:riboflavin kinase n=1 Tax=Candidatus Magasanikbacteria bacterium CG11_big_fil_rev_8_21_14_0_20_43_7 TaxID=1974654 RepID=A0A2H0N2I2_9BACT|nr:MAG: hypothetical protein COV60_02135 [Candidatus Magasanikbacteria bacterium CG11_big_fil_rev_8_21_14_0_20_43_7]